MLTRQKNEVLEAPPPSLILRDGAELLTKELDSPLVEIVLGPRRCGKSTLIKQVLKKTGHMLILIVRMRDSQVELAAMKLWLDLIKFIPMQRFFSSMKFKTLKSGNLFFIAFIDKDVTASLQGPMRIYSAVS